jgi:hypothetical protein
LFENSYKVEDESLQKRRSFPIDSILLNSFPSAFKKLIRFVKRKKFAGKSEVKLGLVFNTFSQEKHMMQVTKIQELAKKKEVDDMFEVEDDDDDFYNNNGHR